MFISFEAIFYENDVPKEKDTLVIYDKEWQEEAQRILKEKYPSIEYDREVYREITGNVLSVEEIDEVVFVGNKGTIVNNISKLRRMAKETSLIIVSEDISSNLKQVLDGFSRVVS